MDEQRMSGTGKSILKSLFFTVKRNILLILAVVILCTAAGVGYSYTKKPNYTASEEVIYIASNHNGSLGSLESVNTMMGIFYTVVDFCDEGVVVDRANYLYGRFLNECWADSGYTIDEFIDNIELHNKDYNENNMMPEKNIVGSKVNVSAKSNKSDSDVYAFTISYTDADLQEAIIKAKIYIQAFRAEVNSTMGDKGGKYFDGVDINIIPLGHSGWVSDVSKLKIAIVGFLLGVVISAGIVFVINMLDNTVKSKDELEELTGVGVLSYIKDMGGRR